MSEVTREFTGDTSDRRLLAVDIRGSLAHVRMLGATGIIDPSETETLVRALDAIASEADSGEFVFLDTDEDVHTAVERRLGELVGEVAGKLHTGRSRNDQVALDLRLYVEEIVDLRSPQLHGLVGTLVDLAERYADTVIPTYTHLQQAQSTTLGDHLLAYASMLFRDIYRLGSVTLRSGSPLGAGASAGTSLPIDREMTAEALGLGGVMANTLDAVASRDLVSEYVFVCAQAMVHLSRLAEEIVLWSTKEFGWVTLGDDVSTGSSALPHKRNPDIAELIRGRTPGVISDLGAILGIQKGLPLTYNRDLQEDKRILFHADDTLAGSLVAMDTLLRGITFHPPAPTAETSSLDLADVLVTRGVPFREAHHIVGRVVRTLEDDGRTMDDLTDRDLELVDDRFRPGDAALVDPATSIARRGIPERVRDQIAAFRLLLE